MNETNASLQQAVEERIDAGDEGQVRTWAERLDVTAMQIKDAVAEVGDLASAVEMHLKGSRSTTNDDRIENAGAGNA